MSGAREDMLTAIRATKPGPRPLPSLPPDTARPQVQREDSFRKLLAQSKTEFVDPQALADYVGRQNYGTVVSRYAPIEGNLDPAGVDDPLQLAGVDLAVLHAQLGVAENGAMWVSEDEAVHRVLPFITQHLVLILPRDRIVSTMHEAYRRLDIAATGFGVFIAGPSKTADIEQSLVIGAHGPRSLVVCLI